MTRVAQAPHQHKPRSRKAPNTSNTSNLTMQDTFEEKP